MLAADMMCLSCMVFIQFYLVIDIKKQEIWNPLPTSKIKISGLS